MLIELILIFAAYVTLATMEPSERQRERERRGLAGNPLREQLDVLRRAGVVRSR